MVCTCKCRYVLDRLVWSCGFESRGRKGMDAVQDNHAEHCLTYLPDQPVPWGHQIQVWGDLGSSSLSSSTHQHPLTWGIADGEAGKMNQVFQFPVSAGSYLPEKSQAQDSAIFFSHPRKREREQRISPAPPLQSCWALELPFLTRQAVYTWVVRKNWESSVRGMSFQRVGCEEILERWFLRRSSHYIFVLVPHVLFKKQHSMKDYSWANDFIIIYKLIMKIRLRMVWQYFKNNDLQ